MLSNSNRCHRLLSNFNIAELNIILAEDEPMFQDLAVQVLHDAGVAEGNIRVVNNGACALKELLQMQDCCNGVILMMLDLRMPTMDGRECAKRVKEMINRNGLRVVPFVVACSSSAREASFDNHPDAIFQGEFPKPFADKHFVACVERLKERCQSPPRAALMINTAHFIVAHVDPVCRMALLTQLTQLGATSDNVCEVDDCDAVVAALQKAQSGGAARPLAVFVGHSAWIDEIGRLELKRAPFIVCTSTAGPRGGSGKFHAILPVGAANTDLKDILQRAYALLN